MAEKKPDFVVSDRRKFTDEGELRADVREEVPTPPQSPAPTAAIDSDPPPEPPSSAEQDAQQKKQRFFHRAASVLRSDMVTGRLLRLHMLE